MFRQNLRRTLIAGFVALLPALIFYWVLKWLIHIVAGLIVPISLLFGPETRSLKWLSYAIIGTVLFLVCLGVGALVRTRRGMLWQRKIEDRLEKNLFGYSFIKSITGQLFGGKRFLFSDVVIANLFNSTTKAIGFVTDTHRDGSRSVFVPTGPNPTTGFIFILPDREVTPIDVPIDITMKSIIACGNGSAPLMDTYLDVIRHDFDLRTVTPTLCQLMNVPCPAQCEVNTLPIEGKVTRALVYLPDAIGVHLFQTDASLMPRILEHASQSFLLQSVYPPKTPVCFASMFTGALPAVHGIRTYTKPVLAIDTLFDAYARAGRKVALIAVKNSSMEMIFRGRAIDYFTEQDDDAVRVRARELISRDEHEVVVVYQQAYDDALHSTTVFSNAAMSAARNHVDTFTELAVLAQDVWRKHNRVYVFAPDHGAHDENGHGDHGLNQPSDMQIRHFWGIHLPDGE
jgi:uncharacterized membrane protein